jgi:homospermidine synthase
MARPCFLFLTSSAARDGGLSVVEFKQRVLFVGYGSVAQCTLPILLKHIDVPPKNITVIDFEDQHALLQPWVAQGVRFERLRIDRENLGQALGERLSAGDLLIDLAWNIDCCEIVQWCHDHGVLYLNTSIEVWDPYDRTLYSHPTERTLYWRHMNVRRMRAGWSQPGPTAVLEHGANPGLISHFTKHALVEIGERVLDDKKVAGAVAEQLQQALACSGAKAGRESHPLLGARHANFAPAQAGRRIREHMERRRLS